LKIGKAGKWSARNTALSERAKGAPGDFKKIQGKEKAHLDGECALQKARNSRGKNLSYSWHKYNKTIYRNPIRKIVEEKRHLHLP